MITPADSPSAPEQYAAVAVQPAGILAPDGTDAVTAAFDQANADGGQGVLYPPSERQAQTKALVQSPPGFALDGYDIDAGTAFGWPNNVEPAGM
jgi:hypothetical protein